MPDFTPEQMQRIDRLYDVMIGFEKGQQYQNGITFDGAARQGYRAKPKYADVLYRLPGYKNDPPAGGGVGPFIHGVGGLFSTPGQEPTVFSTFVQPMQTVANNLPVMPQGSATPPDAAYGGYTAPFFTTVTGVTAGAGDDSSNQPAEPCDDPPVGGLLKACTTTAPYGRYSMATRQISIDDVGQLVNRGEPTDLRLVNGILNNNAPFQLPSGIPLGGDSVLRREMATRFMEMGASFQRLMARQTWIGSPANNNAGGGYAEFSGLDLFIAAGNKVDAFTGIACPAMDSDIKDFGFDMIAGSGRDIVEYVDMLCYFIEYLAENTGIGSHTFALAMRPNLFDELVKVWPIRYYQEFLATIAAAYPQSAAGFNIGAVDSVAMRDDMRNGSFLFVRGQRVPVFQDSTITELNSTTNAQLALGQYASDIYYIPLTVLGGIPVTWWEYFEQNNLQANELEALGARQTWTTDAGMFRWFVNHRNGCFTFNFRTRPRLVLRTPQLAGRIQNVGYEPLQHVRSYDPTSPYFSDGGRTNSPISNIYTSWSPTTPVPTPG